MKPEYKAKFKDKLFRLNNLYFIKDKKGNRIRFKMTPEQLYYFENIHYFNLILKARQLGFTTEVCILQLDAALFESAVCALIAHTQPDAQRLFRNKVKYAYDNLPLIIRDANPLVVNNTDEYVFTKGGSVTVSTSFRGGTLKWLHVSEFGSICAKHPIKAREIVTGAIEAVAEGGYATLESTAEGRKGYFFDYCSAAYKQELAGVPLADEDWRLFFFAWWENPEYVAKARKLPEVMTKYFAQLEHKHGIKLTGEQKSWYYAKCRRLGADMKREYPSIFSEAFEQSIKGAYYADQFIKLYAKGAIAESLPVNEHQPVSTYWDLGVGDSTSIWFIKKVGAEYHVIDFYENNNEGLNHYLKVLKDKGYDYDRHVAPHDVENRTLGSHDAKSLKQQARDGYMVDGERISINFDTVSRTKSVMGDIQLVRDILPHCVFDAIKCADGLAALEQYRKEWNENKSTWSDKPLHDWTSHAADAFRMFAVYESKPKPAKKLNITFG